jgi:hypothetical protein
MWFLEEKVQFDSGEKVKNLMKIQGGVALSEIQF